MFDGLIRSPNRNIWPQKYMRWLRNEKEDRILLILTIWCTVLYFFTVAKGLPVFD